MHKECFGTKVILCVDYMKDGSVRLSEEYVDEPHILYEMLVELTRLYRNKEDTSCEVDMNNACKNNFHKNNASKKIIDEDSSINNANRIKTFFIIIPVDNGYICEANQIIDDIWFSGYMYSDYYELYGIDEGIMELGRIIPQILACRKNKLLNKYKISTQHLTWLTKRTIT